MKSLKICVCTNRHMPPHFVASLAMMTMKLGNNPAPFSRLNFMMAPSISCLPIGREQVAEIALSEGFTHVLLIDDDMTFPDDAAHRLAKHDKRIVGVNYIKRQEKIEYTAKDLSGKELVSVGRTGLERVSRIGFGLLLIDTDVFKKVPRPRFQVLWDEEIGDAGGYRSEDAFFIRKAIEAGESVYVDHGLSRKCTHLGDYSYCVPE